MNDLPDPSDRLSSWKEIGAFLGRTARTAQRWEKTAGLPVHRGGAGRRGTVVASRREVLEWWQRRGAALEQEEAGAAGQSGAPGGRIWPAAGALAAAAIAAAVWALAGDRPGQSAVQPIRIGRVLAAATSEGRAYPAIDLGAQPSAIAVSPDGRQVYVTLPHASAVAVVDAGDGRVVRTLPSIAGASVSAIAPDGNRLYVGSPDAIGVIDLARGSFQEVRAGFVRDLQVSVDGSRVWVALGREGLRVLDATRLTLETVPTVGCPMYFALAPRSRRLFLSYQCWGPGGRAGHDAIEVRDERTGESLVSRAGPPMVGSRLTLTPDEQLLWADSHDFCAVATADRTACPPVKASLLHAFRAGTLDHIWTVGLPARQSGSVPRMSPDGSRLVVSASGIHVVDVALGDVEERADFTHTGEIAFSPDGRYLYVADLDGNALVRIPIAHTPDARALESVGSYWPGDGMLTDVVGGVQPLDGIRAKFAPGRLGEAFSFQANEIVTFGARLDVSLPHQPAATYMAWLKPFRAGAPMTIMDRSGAEGWRWWLTAEGRLAFCVTMAPAALACDVGGLIAGSVLPRDAWSHVAIVRDGTSLRLFVNGSIDTHASVTVPTPPGVPCGSDCTTTLGRNRNGRDAFTGLIDEIVMFRRALGADEIREAMRLTTFASGR